MAEPVFKSAFQGPEDEYNRLGIRPVVFDILGPDHRTSILPNGLKMVLHVNPRNMNFTYNKKVEVIQTLGGYVEQHWGEDPTGVSFEMVTGKFMRLYTGLTSVTGPGPANSLIRPVSAQAQDLGGTRRQTIAYDKYLDFLALYKNNGSIYDREGRIVYQGQVKMSFDGSVYYGWFENFSVSESAESPFMFSLSASFTVEREDHLTRSRRSYPGDFTVSLAPGTPVSDDPPQTDLDPEDLPDQGSTGFDFSEP